MTTDAIAAAFARARDYDRHAHVQRRVAEDLADAIALLPVVRERGHALRLLEIGCGTGFLTEALARRGLGGDWLVTDLAPAMVERCRARMDAAPGRMRCRFRTLDGQRPDALGKRSFDLICSSLAFQWFADPAATANVLTRRLAPGGALAFTTLLDGTFTEWAAAHREAGLHSGIHAYPDASALRRVLTGKGAARITVTDYREQHRSAHAFLRALKAIGAGTPGQNHRPLGAAQLRAVMARFDASGAEATYRVGQVIRTAPEAAIAPCKIPFREETTMPFTPARAASSGIAR